MILEQSIIKYIEAHQREAFDLLLDLARIPAPSNQEQLRAAFCKKWLDEQGAEGVYIDDALNVVWPIDCDGQKPIAVFVAHSDVVFPDMEPLPLKIEEGKICCPGIGDDSANVAALLMAGKFIAEHQLVPEEWGVLIVINSGEEGLGNLKGVRKIMADYGPRIREFVAFDAHDCLGVNKAVGSRRYRVEIDTEGGHSYTAFGNRNAIACMADMIHELYSVKLPEKGRTTYNVGTISGGTSVNTIAQHGEMLYEFRSDARESLDIMERYFQTVVESYRAKGIHVAVTQVGERPCSADVDEAKQKELMARASTAAKRYYGREITWEPGSTDCNIPLAMGIPAVCTGCYFGGGSHTRQEYVWIDSLLPGMKVAFELVLHYF